MFHKLIKKSVLTTVIASSITIGANRPFPQEVDFAGCIKPSNVTQTQMNSSVSSLYDSYISSYLKSYGSDQYYIEASGNGPGGNSSLSISEAHGYGMIIFALMAGYDSNAQEYFDGMFRFSRNCPSESNNYLMSWIADIQSSAATDGDMDIAYALILADKQWGSNGDIDYLQAAKDIITYGIKADEMSYSTKRIMLGDWDTNDYTTRSSDWMTGHLRAFEDATGDSFWNDAANTVYSLISQLTSSYASSTGLMPDFIAGSNPYPDATGGGTGEENAENYSYNACRFPWRIALDYAHNTIPEAKDATSKISTWLRSSTGGDAESVKAGYTLSGTALSKWGDLVFNAPFAAGMITDEANQEFLNDMWALIKDDAGSSEYAHALNLLSMLLISGNWWAPTEMVYVAPSEVSLSNTKVFEDRDAGTFIGRVSANGTGAPFEYELVVGMNDFTLSNDSLFSARIFDVDIDKSLSVTVKATDREGATAQNSIDIAVNESGGNVVSGGDWKIEIDEYGSTSVDTGSALVNPNVTVDFTLGRTWGENYVYGSVKTDDLGFTLQGISFVRIRYRTTNTFNVSLPMSSVYDDAYHAAELPNSNGDWREVSLPVAAGTFIQPEWGSSVTFDPSKVSSISFDATFEGASGEIEIESIFFDRIPSPVADGLVSSQRSLLARVVGNKLALTVPAAGVYRVAVYNVNGQYLGGMSQQLAGGSATVEMSELNLGSQMLLIEVVSVNHRGVFKQILK